MIVISVHLRSAVTHETKLLGRAIISNEGVNNDGSRGNYSVVVGHKKHISKVSEILEQPLRTGSVSGYPRASYNVWRLVIRALVSCFPEESKNK